MTLAQLLKLRMSGQRPDGVVVLSLCGRLPYDLAIEYRHGDDMRGVVDLRVVVACVTRQINRAILLVEEAYLRGARETLIWNVQTNRWCVATDEHEVLPLATPPIPCMDAVAHTLRLHAENAQCA